MFERDDTDAQIFPRVQLGTTVSIATTNGAQLAMGSYVRQSGNVVTLINDTTDTIFTLDATDVLAFSVNYTITRDYDFRTGTLLVTSDVGDSSGGLVFTDDFIENNPTGITLSVSQAGDVISVDYTATETGVNGTISYSIAYLA